MTHSIICFLEKVSGFASETFKLVKNFLDLFCKYWESPFRKICSARKFLVFFCGFGFAAAGRVQIRNSPGKRGYAAFGKRHFLPFFTKAARCKIRFRKTGRNLEAAPFFRGPSAGAARKNFGFLASPQPPGDARLPGGVLRHHKFFQILVRFIKYYFVLGFGA